MTAECIADVGLWRPMMFKAAISQILFKAAMKPAVTAKNALDADRNIRSLTVHPRFDAVR